MNIQTTALSAGSSCPWDPLSPRKRNIPSEQKKQVIFSSTPFHPVTLPNDQTLVLLAFYLTLLWSVGCNHVSRNNVSGFCFHASLAMLPISAFCLTASALVYGIIKMRLSFPVVVRRTHEKRGRGAIAVILLWCQIGLSRMTAKATYLKDVLAKNCLTLRCRWAIK